MTESSSSRPSSIAKVQIRVDEGDWRDAEIAETAGPDTWRQWRYDWAAEPGDHRLSVRAFDADGRPQVEAEAPPAPDGSTGLHTVSIRVQPA